MRIAENLTLYKENPSHYECVNIPLDGSLSSNLSFPNLEAKIREVVEDGKKISLEIFLDIHTNTFSFYSEFELSIRKRSLEVLLAKISFLDNSHLYQIIFYRGTIDFSNHIKSHALTEEEYIHWKKRLSESIIDEEHLLHLFSSYLLSTFFHSIGSILPLEIQGAVLLTTPSYLSNAKIIELISDEIFPHLTTGIKNPLFFHEGISWGDGHGKTHLSYAPIKEIIKEQDVKTAIILPALGLCNYQKFDHICKLLQHKKIPYKIIEENLMNEKWFDIDHILFDEENTSFDGKRMVDGFIAAGGSAYTFQEKGIQKRENVSFSKGFYSFNEFILQS